VIMQNIATEMNLSETAFAVKESASSIAATAKFNLRWFTPKCEVDLCGHATLATAKVLHEIFEVNSDTITFATKSGELTATRKGDYHWLDFPAGDPRPVDLPDMVIKALSLYDSNLDGLLLESYQCSKTKILLLRFKEMKAVHEITPDFGALLRAEEAFGSKGIIVTAEGEKDYDFISRFFAPIYGIDEDPVTGAAHTVLTPYWSKVLRKKKMQAYQASRRGGELVVELREEPNIQTRRVLIGGKSVIVIRGTMWI
jgi:PhzF family phenazine biosynthesis protein